LIGTALFVFFFVFLGRIEKKQKWLEESRLEFEQGFRNIFDNANDGIILADIENKKFSLGNKMICSMLGFGPEEINTLGVADIHPEKDLSRVIDTFERQQMREFSIAENLPVKRKDGTVFFADISSYPVTLGGKRHLVGIFRDTTERMKAEERIRDSEARYRSIFENADDSIYLLDPDGTFRSLNPAFERITGWAPEEWLGEPFAPIVHPDDLPHANEIFMKTLAGESSPSFGLRLARKSGVYFDADLRVSPLLGSDGTTSVLGIARDVTDRKRAEEEIRRLNAELETRVQERTRQLHEAQDELIRKEKLAILGQLSGSVGHELRNPLGVMSNAVYFLKMVLTEADETVQQYLDIIKNEIDNSLRIITDLLDFARTKAPQIQAVNVRSLINESLSHCIIPENLTFKTEIPDNLPPLGLDPLQIEQVLQNLITNGIQAMPGGGTMHIRAGFPEASSEQPHRHDHVEISVADTGEGISPENMKNLFQPLFTTKAKGIGLGLVVCKNLVEANGGRIEVESAQGQETIFTLTLPVAERS
jgi:PAS domain S-box-containing protein